MKKNRAPISNINIVPYLDVMLVLLVIFMITAPLFNQGVVDLPSVGDTALSEKGVDGLEIVYFAAGVNRFQLIDHAKQTESVRMNRQELFKELGAEQILRPKVQIFISADQTVSFGEVVELYGALNQNGFLGVGFSANNQKK